MADSNNSPSNSSTPLTVSVAAFLLSHWIAASLLTPVAYYVLTALYSKFLHPLRNIPAPGCASWSRWWLNVTTVSKGNLHGGILEAHNKYGPIIRVAPNKVYISDPTYILEIYGVNSKFYKSDLYEISDPEPGHGSTFSERNNAKHAELRRRVAPAYSNTSIFAMESYIDSLITNWVDTLTSEFTTAKPASKNGSSRNSYSRSGSGTQSLPKLCDFTRWSQYLTYDIISSLAFGKPFGFIATRSDFKAYIESLQTALPMIVTMSYYTELVKIMGNKYVRKWTSPSIKDETGYGNLTRTATELVGERWRRNGGDRMGRELRNNGAGKEERKDMLQRFWEQGLSEKEAFVDATLILVAGSDSTATAIRSTVLFICSNPPIYNKLRSELSAHIPPQTSTSKILPYSTAITLPYLTACIKESLRLFPPGAGAMERVVPAGGATFHNYHLPAGTVVCMHPWPVARDAVAFSPDPNTYRPERWLEGNTPKEQLQRMEKCVDFVWGFGRHYCLGKGIASMEIWKGVAELFARFELGLANVTGAEGEECGPWKSREYGFFVQSGMLMKLERRV